MSEAFIRLIIRVPDVVQTGPDSWQDRTTIRTFDLSCPGRLREMLFPPNVTPEWRPVIIAAEFRGSDD